MNVPNPEHGENTDGSFPAILLHMEVAAGW